MWVIKLLRDPNSIKSSNLPNPKPTPAQPSPAPAGPSQFFLAFGESYFLLLEYQRSSGIPMEGRVITPKAAQSSLKKKKKKSDMRTWVSFKRDGSIKHNYFFYKF